MAASYTVEGTQFKVEAPRPWPAGRYQTRGRNRMFDLHPDGEHVVLALAAIPPGNGANRSAQFVFNFFEDLQRLAPGTRSMPMP